MVGIPEDLMGDVWPEAVPGREGADYGSVAFSPEGRFPVRSFQTFTVEYIVGEYGIDDTGAIKIVQRWTGDQGPVQFDDPAAPNYVTATASNGVRIALYAEPYPHQRPWYNGLRATVEGGFMRPGDKITIVYGDRSGGSPGYRMQTFCEAAFEFKVLADPCATCTFIPVSSHAIEVGPGPVENWVLVAPTLRRIGEAFSLGVRAEDKWGNATDDLSGVALPLRVEASGAVAGLPAEAVYADGARSVQVSGLTVDAPCTTHFVLMDANDRELARSNPLVTRGDGSATYWGDLHGQSGETVGINPMAHYLGFARDVAFLDVTSHQANDFQLTNAFWAEINRLSAMFNVDGSFVVFPGYEWSGNTPVGGDHNVFFRNEGRQIRRSSHALLTDRSDLETDAPTLTDLFAGLQDEDCVLYAHVGGRPADISYADDPRLRRSVEVHSDWGTFEWILTDAFALGQRVGVVCNSDGHKGAPGACHPGASEFGAYSGLTCFEAERLDRDGIFAAMRARRHYGTTGCRLHLDVEATLAEGSVRHAEDPRLGGLEPPEVCGLARMGDIVTTPGERAELRVACAAHAPIERIDVFNGPELMATRRPYHAEALGGRVRVIWQGAAYRGRGRQVHWKGQITVNGPSITRMAKLNAWNHERPFHQVDAHTVAFDAVTTGNFSGCDLWLNGGTDGQLQITWDHGTGTFDLSDIGLEDQVLDAGGLDCKVRVFRLPEQMDHERMGEMTVEVPVSLEAGRDNPLWVRVTTEDGHRAWSSPIYAVRS